MTRLKQSWDAMARVYLINTDDSKMHQFIMAMQQEMRCFQEGHAKWLSGIQYNYGNDLQLLEPNIIQYGVPDHSER